MLILSLRGKVKSDDLRQSVVITLKLQMDTPFMRVRKND